MSYSANRKNKKNYLKYFETVANRARQLQDHPEKLGTNKPVSMAVDELYHDKLILNAPKDA